MQQHATCFQSALACQHRRASARCNPDSCCAPHEMHLRGPMDEMRQLLRIMVKVLPQSLKFVPTDDGGCGCCCCC